MNTVVALRLTLARSGFRRREDYVIILAPFAVARLVRYGSFNVSGKWVAGESDHLGLANMVALRREESMPEIEPAREILDVF